jgi:hypothetical protein
LSVSLGLDGSGDALTHVVDFKFDIWLAIVFETGLDGVLAAKLDTGGAATFTRCTFLSHKVKSNNVLDEVGSSSEWVNEEIGGLVELDVASVAWASWTWDANNILEVITTWFVFIATFVKFQTADIVSNKFSASLSFITEDNGDDTGNSSWSITVALSEVDLNALFACWGSWIEHKLLRFDNLFHASHLVFWEILRSETASKCS